MGHADPSVTAWAPTGSSTAQGSVMHFIPRGSFEFGVAPQAGFAYPVGVIWDVATIFQNQIADMRPQ